MSFDSEFEVRHPQTGAINEVDEEADEGDEGDEGDEEAEGGDEEAEGGDEVEHAQAETTAAGFIVVDNSTGALLINSPVTWAVVHGDIGAIQRQVGRGAPRTRACWKVSTDNLLTDNLSTDAHSGDSGDGTAANAGDGTADNSAADEGGSPTEESDNDDEHDGSIVLLAESAYTDTLGELDEDAERRRVEAGEAIPTAGEGNWNSVHLAARQGSAFVILALLQAGEDEHAVRMRRFGLDLPFAYAPSATALVDAVSRKRLRAASCLLRYRNPAPNPRRAAAYDYQALQEATRAGSKSTVRLLLRHKVSPNWPPSVGPPSVGPQDVGPQDVGPQNVGPQDVGPIVRGATPLFLAANCLWPNGCLGVLLAAKACVNARNHDGCSTPLHGAAASGCISVARELLTSRADAGARDACGRTAIEVASAAGHVAALTFLLAATPWYFGCSVSAASPAPLSADCAAFSANGPPAPLASSANGPPAPLASPANGPPAPLASPANGPPAPLASPADWQTLKHRFSTCLHAAAANQRRHCVDLIVRAASAQMRSQLRLVMLVHERLVRKQRVRTTSDVWVRVASMICVHPVIDARDQDGNTALALAVSVLNPLVVEQLLRARADPLATDGFGDTPLAAVKRAVVRIGTAPASAERQHMWEKDAVRCRELLDAAHAQRARAQANPTALLWRPPM